MSFLFINVVDCIAFALFLYLFIAFRDHRRRRGHPYPPGPPSHPILGNLLDVPKRAPWVTYADMSKKYGMGKHAGDTSLKLILTFQGDVFCIHIFGQVLVVLCSLPAIKDLLEKRGEAYADRPTLPIMEMYVDCRVIIPDHPPSSLERTRVGHCLMLEKVKSGAKDESFWIAAFDLVRPCHIAK